VAAEDAAPDDGGGRQAVEHARELAGQPGAVAALLCDKRSTLQRRPQINILNLEISTAAFDMAVHCIFDP